MVTRALCGSWLVLALVAACDEPRCEPITGCDIRSPHCQREALRVAACLRGSPADSDVEVEVVDYDTFVDDEVSAAIEAEPSQDDIDRRAGLARFELSVALDTEEDVRRRYDWVAAFYRSDTDRVTVLDRGASGADNERSQTILLVHEMTHALQGADGLLDRLYDPVITYDGSLATRGLVEGEATLVEDQALIEALGFDFDAVDYGRALGAYRDFSRAELVDAEDPFAYARSAVPYAFGTSLLYGDYRQGGIAAVARRLEQPLASTRELLGKAPSKARVRAPIPVREGATLVGVYHLGSFLFDAFLQRLDPVAPDLLGHVIDDVFSVQRLADGKLLAAWRLRFDSGIDARELGAFIERSSNIPYRLGGEDDRDLWLLREPDDATDGEPPSFEAAPALDTGFIAPQNRAPLIHCGR